jgi:hypothetical protein
MKNSNLKKCILLIAVIITTLLSGCAEMTGWHPTVDTYNDPNAYRIGQDMIDCKQLAGQASGSVKETLIDGGVGALLGAAAGAATGAFLGNPGLGAAVGAAGGGFGGAGFGGMSSNEKYKSAYSSCMSGRGHHVLR